MLTTILIWGYILLLTSVTGHFIFSLAARASGNKFPDGITLRELSITGIAGIGTFLALFSLFARTGILANLIIISFCIIWFFLKREEISQLIITKIRDLRKIHIPVLIASLILFILLILFTQMYPSVYDTGLYHAQNIKWISSYRVIPGLGNLHGRFAFNNQSFLLEALFSFSFLLKGPFHVLNGYLLLILSFTLIRLIHQNIRKSLPSAAFYTSLMFLLMIFYLRQASSPAPDIFSLTGIWFVFIIFFERISNERRLVYWGPVLIISFFLVTVKLSALPIALIAILYLFGGEGIRIKKILFIMAISLIIFIPFIVRNYILSGYPVYPSTSLDFFRPDWKIPSALVSSMKDIISAHARTRDLIRMPFYEWFPAWYSRLSSGFKFISWFVLISPITTVGFILISGFGAKRFANELKIISICFIAIVFWFFSAPNYRFIYAFLFFYILTSLMVYSLIIREKFLKNAPVPEHIGNFLMRIAPPFVMLLFLAVSFWSFQKIDYKEIRETTFLPEQYKTVPIKEVMMNNILLVLPADSTNCWNSPLPCSLFQKDIGVTSIELRGRDLQSGFRHVSK